MKRLEIQRFLDTTGETELAFARLQESYGIYARRHPDYPNLIQFSYDQIESSGVGVRDSDIVRECRGIILDENDNWKVVAFPFKRFFNADEPCSDDINWKNCRVQEKVDGSLMILYYYDGGWRVATKGSPNAGGNVGTSEIKFSKLFWASAEYFLGGFCKSGCLNTNYTYMVELTSPLNRVVCDYTTRGPAEMVDGDGNLVEDPSFIFDTTGFARDGSRLTLIGVRDISKDGYPEIPVSMFAGDWHYVVKEFPLGSLDEVVAAAAELNPIEQEGYVIVDDQFRRIKVKSPAYVAIHHIKDAFTMRRMLELVRLGEEPEVLSYFPEYQEQLRGVHTAIDRLVEDIQNDNDRVIREAGPAATQKEFALLALTTRLPAALFAYRSGKYKTIRQFVLSLSAEKLENLLRGSYKE